MPSWYISGFERPRGPTLAGAAVAYTAQGVLFDGTNDYLTLASGLSGAVNSKVGTFSCWFQMTGNDAGFSVFIEPGTGTSNGLNIYRWNDNKLRFIGRDTGNATTFDFTSNSTYANGMGWKHILASWDCSTSTVQLYVNDVDDLAAGATINNVNTDYAGATQWTIGARVTPTIHMFGNIADMYVNFATALDFSNSANRRKFITAGGAPVDLGSDGSTPTGSAPIIYLHGDVSSWETNDGTGGGFTENGALTASATNPP